MAAIPFEIGSSQTGDTVIVSVGGEIDMTTGPELVGAVELVPDAAKQVVLDLGEVTFLDSSALNALIQCQRALLERKIEFRIAGPKDRAVRRVFEITRLTEPLNVVDSLEDALG